MKNNYRVIFLFFIQGIFLVGNGFSQTDNSYQTLVNVFNKPNAKAIPKIYWWWLNGHTDKKRLLEELVAIKNAGINGVDIFDIGARAPNNPNHMIPGGPAFMGPESLETIVAVIKKATALNMEVDLSLSSSWNAGGSWIKPEFAGKSLYYSTVKLQGGSNAKIVVPFPVISAKDEKGKTRVIVYDKNGKPVYRKEVAVLAIPEGMNRNNKDTSVIINVSRFFDSEKDELNWLAPAGNWEIQRYVCSNSGEQLKYYSDNSAGPIIDHFDSASAREHVMYFINHLQPLLGDFSKTALKSLYLASFEATGSVWTGSLPAEFRKVNGYDIYKMLPAIFNPQFFDSTTAKKFRHDFDLVISELMIHQHYGKAREIANKYGLQLISEAGGPGPPLHNAPIEALQALGALDVPRGEFWNKHAVYDSDSIDLLMLVKEISAAAHIYHRDIVELESFTSFQNWNEGPFDLKPLGDRAFCEGMSRVVIHGFSHNPAEYGFPGIVYHAGTHLNDKNIQWPKIKPFTEYLSRISAVMQKTNFVADVLYYYGDDVPNFVTPKNTRYSVGHGYDYEIINSDVLLRELFVKNGMLVLPGGASFRILELGKMEAANPAVIEKLKQLAASGAIITGKMPLQTNSLLNQPQADKKIQQSAQNTWTITFDKTSIGKGKILTDIPSKKILELLNVKPDFEYMDPEAGVLDYIHQQHGDIDVYFVRNVTDKWISRNCSFRITGKSPEVWDPVTASVSPVTIYEELEQQTSIPVTLAPYQSYFFVFQKKASLSHYNKIIGSAKEIPMLRFTKNGVEFLQDAKLQLTGKTSPVDVNSSIHLFTIDGGWKVEFSKGFGSPGTVEFPKLISWTDSENPSLKYFSGSGMYQKSFTYNDDIKIASNEHIYLDLGNISKIAEVWLNGKSLGITWTMPYRFDITGLLKKGDNELKIEVINVWSNRIVGDAIRGEKFTETNLPTGSGGIKWAETELVISGLLGPVTLQKIKTVQ